MITAPIDLQEQLLIVLAFGEEESAVIESVAEPHLFEGQYQEIAEQLLLYRQKYGKGPGEGLFSLFTHLKESEAWPTYKETLVSILENRNRVATRFVLDQAGMWARSQSLRRALMDGIRILQEDRNSAEAVRKVEHRLAEVDQVSPAFDAGLSFEDTESVWVRTDEMDEDIVRTGIERIDRTRLGPRRGQLHLLIAPSKTGKSWWGVHLAKMAAVTQQKTVLYITLEIGADEVMRRLHSSMFAIRRSRSEEPITRFETDELGRIKNLEEDDPHTAIVVNEDGFEELIREKIDDWAGRTRVIVKEFASGTLTVSMLNSYLIQMASLQDFRPDLVIVDYADLMEVSTDNLRLELERLFVDLRGLAQTRNFALVTMSQANRRGAESRAGVGVHHVAESWAKVATADTVFTLSRTEEEEKFGLARLKVAASRVEQDGLTVILSQDLACGQFVIDQGYPTSNYGTLVKGA